MTLPVDIGHDHIISFYGWKPDRTLNPHLEDRPDIDILGLRVDHKTSGGEDCTLLIYLNVLGVEHFETDPKKLWEIKELDPLTLSPSLVCKECGDHGFIIDGKWETFKPKDVCELCNTLLDIKGKENTILARFCDRCYYSLDNIYEAFVNLDWNTPLMRACVQSVLAGKAERDRLTATFGSQS